MIALATRSLPEAQRRLAVVGGSAAAVGLRVAFCLVITSLLRIPYLKVLGGLLLLYIGTIGLPQDVGLLARAAALAGADARFHVVVVGRARGSRRSRR